jgi:hypothetical protein
VPMWRRGRPRRSASTTHRCAGSLARVYERTCSASQPSIDNRETFESRIFFALHHSVIRAGASCFRLATLLRPYRTVY